MAIDQELPRNPYKNNDLSLLKVILLIFIPTTVLTSIYLLVGYAHTTIPSVILFFLLAMLFLFPVEIAIVLRASKKEFGSYSFRSAFVNQGKAGWKRTLIIGLLLFGFAGIMSITLGPLEKSLTASLSAKLAAVLPAYFDWTNLDHFRQYSGVSLLLMSTVYLILNGFVGPIVEELFFRGYLTSKLSRYGKVAPVIVTVLFSLYHFWLPFQNLFRISVFLPAAYLTWKEKNIYIGMVFHCISNIFTVISFLVALYAV
ncbi:CAAX protease self-immunity [Longilinea arvoryzae]|uniref:CAAX protease self-immunity n=1 Tax=Longilinea arvoryzae TaxID=360412 RepID=A0A0S7B862_9CHLR|nr:CPBP family intramembrane glutamic endopeptidase [Longilinea arvoryzae]GAP13527.1 CAAX protease self-immunity [Longilinea arvoryzae]